MRKNCLIITGIICFITISILSISFIKYLSFDKINSKKKKISNIENKIEIINNKIKDIENEIKEYEDNNQDNIRMLEVWEEELKREKERNS